MGSLLQPKHQEKWLFPQQLRTTNSSLSKAAPGKHFPTHENFYWLSFRQATTAASCDSVSAISCSKGRLPQLSSLSASPGVSGPLNWAVDLMQWLMADSLVSFLNTNLIESKIFLYYLPIQWMLFEIGSHCVTWLGGNHQLKWSEQGSSWTLHHLLSWWQRN